MELLDRFVGPRHVLERDLRCVLGDLLGLGLAELHDPVPAALELHEDEDEDAEQEDVGEQRGEEPLEQGGVLVVRRDGNTGVEEFLRQRPLVLVGIGDAEGLFPARGHPLGGELADDLIGAGLHLDAGDVTGGELVLELVQLELERLAGARHERIDGHDNEQEYGQVDEDGTCRTAHDAPCRPVRPTG